MPCAGLFPQADARRLTSLGGGGGEERLIIGLEERPEEQTSVPRLGTEAGRSSGMHDTPPAPATTQGGNTGGRFFCSRFSVRGTGNKSAIHSQYPLRNALGRTLRFDGRPARDETRRPTIFGRVAEDVGLAECATRSGRSCPVDGPCPHPCRPRQMSEQAGLYPCAGFNTSSAWSCL